jgi:predicted Zn-dependent peptidase
MTELIRHTELENGLRVVTEQLPALRSAAIGFWVGTGSRDETDELHGASHFLEHLLFKGSEKRLAHEIAEAIESIGGDMNAFTTQEMTAFYVRVPDAELELAVDILSDIFWAPAIREDEVESERHVILEEIKMRDDTPDDLVHELLAQALWNGHPVGREVIGTTESVTGMARETIAGHHHKHYEPRSVVVAAAGNLEHQQVVDLVSARVPAGLGAHADRLHGYTGLPARPLTVMTRATEQAHLVLGMRAFSRHDPDRFALTVLNTALGGGMSSRLFEEVREKRGLAYAVYSYRIVFDDTGALAVYAGTGPGRVDEVLGVIDAELDRLVNEGGISARELDAAKGHLKGSMALSLESSTSRMNRIGNSELTMREILSLDELVQRVDAVTPDAVARVVDRVVAQGERSLAVIGPFDESAFTARVA